MPVKSEMPSAGRNAARYMRLEEVAAELGYTSRGSIYNLIDAGQLTAVSVSPTGRTVRVTRKSFEDYCERIEAEAERRYKTAS